MHNDDFVNEKYLPLILFAVVVAIALASMVPQIILEF